jgi:hypothetical protein
MLYQHNIINKIYDDSIKVIINKLNYDVKFINDFSKNKVTKGYYLVDLFIEYGAFTKEMIPVKNKKPILHV